jgi:hypothetical protein
MFNWIINSYGMIEVALIGGKFTWTNNHADPTLEKLDRVLINEKWEDIFPLTNLRKNQRLMSDHNPLLLCTEQNTVKKSNKQFCFETAWIKHEEFFIKVGEVWGKSVNANDAVGKWIIKMGRVKKNLKGWGNSMKGHARKYWMTLNKELEEIEKLEEETILPTALLDRKTCIQAELLKIMEEEELYWHKRSNENWLLKGDNNTSYFHRKANGKKGKIPFFIWKMKGGA